MDEGIISNADSMKLLALADLPNVYTKAKRTAKKAAAKKPAKPAPKKKAPAKKSGTVKRKLDVRKPVKVKPAAVVRSERMDLRLSKAEKTAIQAKAKKLRRTLTSLFVEFVEKLK